MAETKQTKKKANGLKKKQVTEVATKKKTVEDPYAHFKELDEHAWKRILGFCEQAERELDDVVAEIMETAEADYLQKYPEEDRPRWALRIVAANITVEGVTSADRFQLLVLDVQPPKVIKTKNGPKTIANITGICAKYDDEGEAGEASFAEVAFWDEEADKVNDAEIGKAYDVKLTGSYKAGRFQLRGVPKTNWKTTIELDVDPLELVQDMYERVDLADLEDVKPNAPILVLGDVTFARAGKSEKGNAYGIITIYDDSQDLEDRGVSVFCGPHQTAYGKGSRVWVLGTVQPGKKNPESGEMYPPSMNALAIFDELVVPAQFASKTVEQAQVIDDNEEEEAVEFGDFEAGKKTDDSEE